MYVTLSFCYHMYSFVEKYFWCTLMNVYPADISVCHIACHLYGDYKSTSN